MVAFSQLEDWGDAKRRWMSASSVLAGGSVGRVGSADDQSCSVFIDQFLGDSQMGMTLCVLVRFRRM